MMVSFYDVKARAKVEIDSKNIMKKVYERKTADGKTQKRYAFRAKTAAGTSLTKFVSEKDYMATDAPMEK